MFINIIKTLNYFEYEYTFSASKIMLRNIRLKYTDIKTE